MCRGGIMTWDEYYKKLLEKQPKITWDEYYETAPISRDYYTTEQLYNPYTKPKKKYSSSDFEPLGVEWKYDWKKYGDYDETSVEDQLRKLGIYLLHLLLKHTILKTVKIKRDLN